VSFVATTDQLKAEDSVQTTFRLSPAKYCDPAHTFRSISFNLVQIRVFWKNFGFIWFRRILFKTEISKWTLLQSNMVTAESNLIFFQKLSNVNVKCQMPRLHSKKCFSFLNLWFLINSFSLSCSEFCNNIPTEYSIQTTFRLSPIKCCDPV
jgi:hypothetical protein